MSAFQGRLFRDKELLSLDLSFRLESKWQPPQSDSGEHDTGLDYFHYVTWPLQHQNVDLWENQTNHVNMLTQIPGTRNRGLIQKRGNALLEVGACRKEAESLWEEIQAKEGLRTRAEKGHFTSCTWQWVASETFEQGSHMTRTEPVVHQFAYITVLPSNCRKYIFQ